MDLTADADPNYVQPVDLLIAEPAWPDAADELLGDDLVAAAVKTCGYRILPRP